MIQLFYVDPITKALVIKYDELRGVKEFKDIIDRDLGSYGVNSNNQLIYDDRKGTEKFQAMREFTFIWLYSSIFSPFAHLDQEEVKVNKCMLSSGLDIKQKDGRTGNLNTWNRIVKGTLNPPLWKYTESIGAYDYPVILRACQRYFEFQTTMSNAIDALINIRKLAARQTKQLEFVNNGIEEIHKSLELGYLLNKDGEQMPLNVYDKQKLREMVRTEMSSNIKLADEISKTINTLNELEAKVLNDLQTVGSQKARGKRVIGLTEMPGYKLT